MAKKVLEFYGDRLLARSGGPSTYLFNLRAECKADAPVEIVFLPDLIDFREESPTKGKESGLKQFLKNFVPQKHVYDRRIRRYLNKMKCSVDPRLNDLDLSQFDLIHIHEAIDFFRYPDLLQRHKEKIAFTPHSPIPYHMEMLQEVFGVGKTDISSSVYKMAESIDVQAFQNCALLITPCREALEGYHRWEKFEQSIQNKPFRHVITGCPPVVPSKTDQQVLRYYNIPEKSFVISYSGRHSEIKGYDLLEAVACKVLPRHEDVYFLIAGKKTGTEKFQHSRFIEIGWTGEPYNIVNASSINLILNRETYFDLNTIEVMSLGKPILLTETGGNKYLKRQNLEGLIFVRPDVDEIIEKIENSYQKNKQLKEAGSINKLAFEKYFTSQMFYQNYIQLYKNL